MILCQACKIGSHEHCSAQVRSAKMPCSCEHCWGIGGSEAVYERIDEQYWRSVKYPATIVISPNPQTQGNSEGI